MRSSRPSEASPHIWADVRLFALLTIAGGAGGLGGSILAAQFGRLALFLGGILGGLICSPAAAFVAARLHWIDRQRARWAALGAAIGFVGAVCVATTTLSSPVGPLLSPLLIGTGGLIGSRIRK